MNSRQNANTQYEDGKMEFNYLIDPEYSNKILNTYYVNDDIKINGERMVYHPLQNKNIGFNNKEYGYYSGSLPNNIKLSNSIYNEYAIRL